MKFVSSILMSFVLVFSSISTQVITLVSQGNTFETSYSENVLSKNFDNNAYTLSAVKNDTETECLLTLSNFILESGQIYFAVWSEKSGQDDLFWYEAEYASQNFVYNVIIANHHTSGKYFVHAYNVFDDGSKNILASTNFVVTNPSIISMVVNSSKLETLYFDINLDSIISKSEILSLSLAVWSEESGQDDLRWYTVEPPRQTYKYSCKVPINIGNHWCDLGFYNIHLYVSTGNGLSEFVKGDKYSISFNFGNTTTTVNDNQTLVKVNTPYINVPSSFYCLKYAVWSTNSEQRDLRWDYAVKEGNFYIDNVLINDFGQFGSYNIHCYIESTITGHKWFVNAATFDIDFVTFGSFIVNDIDITKGRFNVEINNIHAPGGLHDKSISLYVWTEKSGQDDMRVYYCNINEQSNPYSANCEINLENHNFETGKYHIHAYARTNNNLYGYVSGINKNIDIEKGALTAYVTSDEMAIDVKLESEYVSKSSTIFFAIWVNADQSDLKWREVYTNKSNSSCSWNEMISEHKCQGLYNVHCYYLDSSGNKSFLTGITVQYTSKLNGKIKIPQESIDGTLGTFKIIVSDVSSSPKIENIHLPTWGNNVDSSHANWYTANKDSDSSYSYTVDVSMHLLYFGTYNIHTYVDLANGIRIFLNGTQIEITPKNYYGIGYIGNGNYKAAAYGLVNGYINAVYFPTWSTDSKWQDDLIWYQASWIASNTWEVVFNICCHRPAGLHRTDPYYSLDGGATKTFVRAIEYDVPEENFIGGTPLLHGNRRGIDVSEHNGNINWSVVASSGQVGYAIIRAGFGWNVMGGRADNWFYQNYVNAKSVGMPVGTYWYSYATNVAEAQAEAWACLSILGGRHMDLPVGYDIEDDAQRGLSSETRTQMINAFCAIIASAGYTPMVYSSESWFNGMFNVDALNYSIYFWVAQWSREPVIRRKNMARFWQYTSDGTIPGISGRVDMNWCYY